MPASLQERLVAADKHKDDYVPSPETARQVAQTTEALGSFVGVTDSGKSYLIRHVLRLGGVEFSEAGNISSRHTRPNDPADFRGNQPIEDLLDRIDRRELVQYAVHGSGDIYGTDPASYTTRYVLLPTLTTALPQLQRSGCFRVRPIGIMLDGATWDERLGDNRHNLPRMLEARTCVAWLRARLGEVPMVENATGQEEATARAIINFIRNPLEAPPIDNLERIEMLLDEIDAMAAKHVRRLQRA